MPTAGTWGGLTQMSPNTFHHFGRLGGSESALAQFLFPFAFRDVVFWFDDFIDPVANLSDHYTLGADTNATTFAKNAGAGGRIQGATGATDNEAHAILTGADWFGNNHAGMEVRWQKDVVTGDSWETGFTDPLTSNVLPAVTDIDTPAIGNGATDVALIHLDADQTLTTAGFVTDGSTTNMNTTSTSLGTYAPTADTYLATRVQLFSPSANIAAARGFVFDADWVLQQSASHGSATANQVNGLVGLTARYYSRTRNTTSKVTTLDYIAIWQHRRT